MLEGFEKQSWPYGKGIIVDAIFGGGVSRLPFSLFGPGAFPFSLPGFCPFPFLEIASKEFQANFQVSSLVRLSEIE